MKTNSFALKHGALISLCSIAGDVPTLPAIATHRLTEIVLERYGKAMHTLTLGELRQCLEQVRSEFGLEPERCRPLMPQFMPKVAGVA